MFQANGRKTAITFTGGIDSTVLSYWILENGHKFDFLTPKNFPPSYRPPVVLLYANLCAQANFVRGLQLLLIHKEHLIKRYGDKYDISHEVIEVPLPSWSIRGNGLYEHSYKPTTDNKAKPDVRAYEDLGPNVYIDGRNTILFTWLLSACSMAQIPNLLTGHQYDVQEWDQLDTYRMRQEDCGPGFVDRMNIVAECGFRNRTRIKAPFLELGFSKYQIALLGKELGIDLEKETYSCLFHPQCGKCGNCVIREKVFSVLRLGNPHYTSVK